MQNLDNGNFRPRTMIALHAGKKKTMAVIHSKLFFFFTILNENLIRNEETVRNGIKRFRLLERKRRE